MIVAAELDYSEACYCEETSHYESGGFCCKIYLSEGNDSLGISPSFPGVYLDLEAKERLVKL